MKTQQKNENAEAERILRENSFTTTYTNNRGEKKTYTGILPSDQYYFNAWFWDTAIQIMALAHVDEQKAYEDFVFLSAAQWDNGHIGHIIYRNEPSPYFPPKACWGTQGKAPSSIVSSGIIQPPLIAISLQYLLQTLKNQQIKNKVIQTILPTVIRYHDYLKATHDRQDTGLISIFHPWSSGSDNAISFDEPLQHIAIQDIPSEIISYVDASRADNKLGNPETRPLQDNYYRFIYLIHLGKKRQWNYKKIANHFPFEIKDISVNSLWYLANEKLSQVLTLLGKEKEAAKYNNWAEQTKNALQHCWSKEETLFTSINASFGQWKPIKTEQFSNFMPFIADATPPAAITPLLKKMSDPTQYWTDYPVPSVPINSQQFEPLRYWRGPTWPIINYFLILGLQKLHESTATTKEQKDQIRRMKNHLYERTLHMIEGNGFFEDFIPIKNNVYKTNGGGFANFSFTAAIYILLTRMQI